MNRRIIAIVLIVLGLSTIGAAIASATVWKPDTTVTVPLPAKPSVNYVITDPGVLNIVNPTVQVRAIADDDETPVFLAMGRTDEVQAWVESSDYGKVTGLTDWEALSYETVDALPVDEEEEGEEAELPANPATSDMWVEEVNGIGEATYTWEEIPGRWSMIVATDGTSPAPMLEFTWEREVPTPALIPGIILGVLLTGLGAVALWMNLKNAKENAGGPQAEELTSEAVLPTEVAPETEPSEETDISPEEIMAGLESGTLLDEQVHEVQTNYQGGDLGELDEDYPHALGEPQTSLPEEQPKEQAVQAQAEREAERSLTRREIRELEREREREAAITGTADGDRAIARTGEIPVTATEPRRKWWQRKSQPEAVTPRGPIVIDDDTGEIIITGEIDVSNLAPQASADSWRATWGLDKDTPTRWIPVIKQEDEGESDE